MTTSVFASAADSFTRLVHAVPATAWDGPGLGDWDMRALVGHTSRSLITVSEYLRNPVDHEDVADAVDYYLRVRDFATTAGAEAIVERGRQAGRDLGADPARTVSRLAHQALADIDEAGDPLIGVIGGWGIRLTNYLQTRVFELAVHGLDIAHAAAIEFDLPADVLEQSTSLAARVAARSGQGEQVLLALTGRAGLPDRYSVV